MSPSHGVEPWAARPLTSQPDREHALGLDPDVHVGGLAGDREVADEALLDELVRAALDLLLGLLVGDDPEPTRTGALSRRSCSASSIAASAPFMS